MASASASPQPPSGRSDTTGWGEPESDAMHREALVTSGSETIRREGHEPHELAEERYTDYGPLSVERHLKQDGRGLILYTRRQRRDG